MTINETAAEVIKSAPPVAVGTLSAFGIPLQEWLIIITIVYTVLQLYFLLRDKWWRQNDKSKD